MARLSIPFLLLLSLASCSYGHPTELRNSYTDTRMVCGPYPNAATAEQDQVECLNRAAAMGYVPEQHN